MSWLNSAGKEVEVQNYIDDMGLQVAQTFLAYRSIEEEPKEKFDHALGKFYVDISEKLDSEPKLEEESREILRKLEKRDKEIGPEVKRMAEKCVESNLETTDRLNIDYDLLVWESDIAGSGMMEETLNRLRQSPYLKEERGEYEGALILKLGDFGLDDKVLIRSNGTPVYTARDLAYQLWKFGRVESDISFKKHSDRPSGLTTCTSTAKNGEEIQFGNGDQVINVIGRGYRSNKQQNLVPSFFVSFKSGDFNVVGWEHSSRLIGLPNPEVIPFPFGEVGR